MATPDTETALADTRRWLERAVIGLNLCPFAKAVQARGLVHMTACASDTFADVLESLDAELRELLDLPASERDTALVVLPRGFGEFLLFNDLVREGERLIRRRGAEGQVQLASFHPLFHFAGAEPDDPANFSNRSPYPTLHLLREESIDRAVAAFPEPEAIFGANIEKLRELGVDGWRALDVGASG